MKVDDIAPEFIMMVGVPGSGKSTYIKNLKATNPEKDYVVLSTDDIISAWGAERGLNYTQAFQKFEFKNAQSIFNANFRKAIKERRNIIVDRTNLTKKGRAKLLSNLPADYKTKAVVFEIDPEELQRRLTTRAKETGKFIPDKVMSDMIASYVPPSKEEFDAIQFVK